MQTALLGNRLSAWSRPEAAGREAAGLWVKRVWFFLKTQNHTHIYGHQMEGWEAEERAQAGRKRELVSM